MIITREECATCTHLMSEPAAGLGPVPMTSSQYCSPEGAIMRLGHMEAWVAWATLAIHNVATPSGVFVPCVLKHLLTAYLQLANGLEPPMWWHLCVAASMSRLHVEFLGQQVDARGSRAT